MKKILVFLLALITEFQGFNQNIQYKNLVFEGGGLMGLAYCGALTELENRNILPSIEKVAGTSVGAITAVLISVGYNADEITKIILETDFGKFNDGSNMFFDGVYRFSKNYGFYKGEEFQDWLKSKIAKKTGNADITFLQLRQSGYKDLYVTGTNLSKQKSIIFSAENFPEMKIADAVRISMSIPMYYESCFVDSVGNVYHEQNDTLPRDLIVDGGLLNNYPIDIFDSILQTDDGLKRIINKQTLGFMIDSEKQTEYDINRKGLAPKDIKDIHDYSESVFILIYETLVRKNLTAEDWNRTISISNVGIGPQVKKISQVQKNNLIESGKLATKFYFSKL